MQLSPRQGPGLVTYLFSGHRKQACILISFWLRFKSKLSNQILYCLFYLSRPESDEDSHDVVGIEAQDKQSWSKWYIFEIENANY